MSIPNILTLMRIILVPVIVIALMQESFQMALYLFVIAAITDGLDGFLARKLHQKTVLGTYLDPLADKALLTSSFITLAILGPIPSWLAVIVISRDLIILSGILIFFFMSISIEMSPSLVSKITTLLQFIVVSAVLVCQSFPVESGLLLLAFLFWLTALITITSGFHYIYKGICYINVASR